MLSRWPPSAAQTGRAVFPHPAFTKTQLAGGCWKGSSTRFTNPCSLESGLGGDAPPAFQSSRVEEPSGAGRPLSIARVDIRSWRPRISSACVREALPLADFVDERVNLPRPRWIDPVHEFPRSMMFGSFAKGTVHLIGLAHLAFCLSPTVFAGRLPRHTLSPGFWSRGFHRASGTTRPSDYSQDTASHFACPYRVTSLSAIRGS